MELHGYNLAKARHRLAVDGRRFEVTGSGTTIYLLERADEIRFESGLLSAYGIGRTEFVATGGDRKLRVRVLGGSKALRQLLKREGWLLDIGEGPWRRRLPGRDDQ